ncbi:MAG TPA: hypothetical protein VJ464_16110 [Blastocatellia bacterium]|nr:hypothetical protein [Blastocatellia bacterium]
MFTKTQDKTIDRLLGAQGGRPGNAASLCAEFDADLASAYVERRLSASAVAGYESHLAACSPCRKSIIALTRLAQAEAAPTPAVATVERRPAISPARRWLGALTAPQWAMAAAAAIVLAITLPLAVSHRATPAGQPPSTTEPANAQATASAPAANPVQDNATGGSVAAANTATEAPATKTVAAAPSEKPAPGATADAKDAAGGAAAPSNVQPGVVAASQPAEPKPADQTIAKNETQTPPAAPATAAGAPQSKSDEKESKPVAGDRDAAKAATAQPSRTEERAKADSAVASETIAPPPPPPTRGRDREYSRTRRDDAVSGPAASFLRPSAAPRVASRKVGSHQFWLHDGTWMDRDYDSGKGLPVVQVIRDSDVYRDLLAKEEKIKPFFTGFPSDARVIFVFKDKVYILIPQKGEQ